jgi:8-oxo-dGTP diphosphatase
MRSEHAADRPPHPASQASPHYTSYDTRLAAYVVVVEEGRVLLALWNEPERKRWTLPGGGVELHETPEEGAVREAREESGYDVELTGLLGIETDVFGPDQRTTEAARDSGRPLKAVRVFYSARIVGGELAREEPGGTTDEARWFPLTDVAELQRVSMVDTGLALLARRE